MRFVTSLVAALFIFQAPLAFAQGEHTGDDSGYETSSANYFPSWQSMVDPIYNPYAPSPTSYNSPSSWYNSTYNNPYSSSDQTYSYPSWSTPLPSFNAFGNSYQIPGNVYPYYSNGVYSMQWQYNNWSNNY
jgi:hypothetical protein